MAVDLPLEPLALIELLVQLPPLIHVELRASEHRLGPLSRILVAEGGSLGRSLPFALHLRVLTFLPIRTEAGGGDLGSVLLSLLLGDLAVGLGLDLGDSLVLRLCPEHELTKATEFSASGGNFLEGEVIHGEVLSLGEVGFGHLGGGKKVGDGGLEVVGGLQNNEISRSAMAQDARGETKQLTLNLAVISELEAPPFF